MKILIALMISVILSSCATRLVTLNNSVHYQDNDFNESHNGIGFEFKANDWWIGYLKYKNSLGSKSRMITFGQEWKITDKWYWGAKMGFADGYDPFTPLAAIGGVTIRYNFFGPLSVYTFITPILTADGLVLDLN